MSDEQEEPVTVALPLSATAPPFTPTTSIIPTTTTTSSSSGDSLPLHARWVLWFDNPRLAPAGSDWKENLQRCGTFDSVESFWRIYNNLKPASQLSSHSNYHLFRDGVQPMWEDPYNCEGGKFVLTMPKKDSRTGRCDEWWLYTVLAVVGETMDANGDQICGAVVSIRKSQDRIALWLKTIDKETCVHIGERWKKALELNKTILKFQAHKDAAASGHSFGNETQFEV